MNANTARTVQPQHGASDFGPYSVEVEYRNGLNTVEDFSDDPTTARFPYAYDRASRCFNLARRNPLVSWAIASGPLGILDSRSISNV